MESNKIIKNILDSYEIINDKKINNASFDRTIQGTILECKDPSIGRYLIRYQDSTIEAYAVSPSIDYPKGNLVYISVPQGDMKNQKTILGSAKQLGTNYIEDLTQEDTFDTTKNLLSTDLKIELSSYHTEETPLDNENIEFTKAIQSQIRNANYLKIKGKVQTNLNNQQKQKGRYGLKITLIIKNNATGVEEQQDYYFDSNNFSGNPYNYRTPFTQQVSYPLDGINFIRVKSISKFVQGFPLQEENKEPDIFISNISINGSYKLTDAEKATVGIILQAPYGYTFSNVSEPNNSTIRPINATIRAKGKLVDLKRQNVEIYWFKADPRITSNHEDYLKYGGSGWKCINNEKLPNPSIEIPLDMVQYNQENLFKCVAVYDNKTFTKEFTIYNYGADYEISIESTGGVNFAYSTGHPNLICHVLHEGKELEENVKYQWKSVNSQNIGQDLNETDTSQYQQKLQQMKQIELIVNKDEDVYWNQQIKIIKENKKLFWWYENRENKETLEIPIINKNIQIYENLNLTWQQRYDELKNFTLNFEKSQRVKGNTIYNLNLYKIIDYTTFYCSCFVEEELVGIAKIVIYNEAATLAGYNLVINNGDQVFLYDQNGMSLQSAAIDQPYNISDLSYTLSYNGVPIEEEQLNFAIPTWKIPLKNTMIEMGTDTGEDYMYVKGQNTLSFDVSNKYNVSNSNNDIYLILQYNDQTFTTKTNFTFNKEGGVGTNGTKYQFKIVPDKNVLYFNPNGDCKSESSSIKVIPQMWFNGKKQPQENFNVSWEILQDKTTLSKWSNLAPTDQGSQEAIIENKGAFRTKGFGARSNNPVKQDGNLGNIIKATTIQNQLNYYATVPISTVFYHINDNNINIKIPDDAGFKYVTYASDGTNPSYNELKPFEIDIYKTIGSQKEDISNKESEHFNYEWAVLPQGKSALEIINVNNNTARIRPKDNFSKAGNQVTNAVLIEVTKNGDSFATIHIPVHMMLNRYENAALNDWDGNTIDINDSGYILTPQVGAGKKEDNAFTGVLLGTERTSDGDKTGLLGYAAGARSIFLDSTTGNATFGLPGKGQIKIDVKDQAIIQSGDYPEKGMKIQFSNDPYIKFGSGNFEVSPEGHIHAVGGGDIAGWNISDNALSKGYVTISSDNNKDTNQAIKITDKDNNKIFSVDYRGYLHSERGDIAGWTIEPTRLFKNNVGMASTGTHAFWAGDNFYVNHNGYLFSKYGNIGGWNITSNKLSYSTSNVTDKVGLSPINTNLIWAKNNQGNIIFSVNNNGYMYAKDGQIGNWRFGSNGLYSGGESTFRNKKGNIYNSGVYVGADGIRLGSNFYVEPSGKIYALTGKIGGCNISSGGISGAGDGGVWKIDGAGNASFKDVTINGASVTGMMKATGSGGISGGGSSIGSGGASLARGSTTVGGQKIDDYVENLIVGTLKANKIWGDLGYIYLLQVTNLYARGKYGHEFNVGDELSSLNDEIDYLKEELAKKANKSDIPSTTP